MIIRKVQRKATTGQVLNVEFYKIKLDRKLTVSVPIKLKVLLGCRQKRPAHGSLFTADVECFPGDIPDFIEGDLSKLQRKADDIIHFRDLEIDEENQILNPAEGVVAKAMAPRVAAGINSAYQRCFRSRRRSCRWCRRRGKEEAAAASEVLKRKLIEAGRHNCDRH
ncbi:MAG: hypothetical protein R3C24_16830 [Cyanobacteriota/Melainabacteria group bacterium]